MFPYAYPAVTCRNVCAVSVSQTHALLSTDNRDHSNLGLAATSRSVHDTVEVQPC
jgi:hypothetical protein